MRSPVIVALGALVIAAGAALAVVRFVGGTPVEGAVGAFAFGAVLATPGVLAIAAQADRPALLLPAAAVLVPLSFLSFVTLPLLVPAILLLRAFATVEDAHPARTVAASAFVIVLLLGALAALFVHQDPRSYTTATGGGSTSDVITYGESLLALAAVAAAITGGWWIARPD